MVEDVRSGATTRTWGSAGNANVRRAARALVGVIVVVGTAVVGTGCGRAHLYYDARELHHQALKPGQKDDLQAVLAGKLAGRKIVRVDDKGGRTAIAATRQGLGRLDLAELGALWLATAAGDNGGENDIRVRTTKGSVPVQVTITLDGDIVVISGGRDADADEGALLSEAQIKERFVLKSSLPGEWKAEERRALVRSLELLHKDELDVVRGLGFERRPASPDRDPSKAALYTLEGCRGKISLYSTGVKSDRFRFVGSPETPRSAVLHSIVHEMGHAFDADEARDAYCAADAAKGARRNTLIERGNELGQGGRVLKAYLEVLRGEPGPTDYAQTSAKESFAESFALFHVDPAALRRVLPRVHAWFAAGGHVKAARRPS